MERPPKSEREYYFGGEEERRDEDLGEVVDERGSAPLERMAEELQHPAADEERREPAPSLDGAATGDQLGEPN
jgi:hypothetical protein